MNNRNLFEPPEKVHIGTIFESTLSSGFAIVPRFLKTICYVYIHPLRLIYHIRHGNPPGTITGPLTFLLLALFLHFLAIQTGLTTEYSGGANNPYDAIRNPTLINFLSSVGPAYIVLVCCVVVLTYLLQINSDRSSSELFNISAYYVGAVLIVTSIVVFVLAWLNRDVSDGWSAVGPAMIAIAVYVLSVVVAVIRPAVVLSRFSKKLKTKSLVFRSLICFGLLAVIVFLVSYSADIFSRVNLAKLLDTSKVQVPLKCDLLGHKGNYFVLVENGSNVAVDIMDTGRISIVKSSLIFGDKALLGESRAAQFRFESGSEPIVVQAGKAKLLKVVAGGADEMMIDGNIKESIYSLRIPLEDGEKYILTMESNLGSSKGNVECRLNHVADARGDVSMFKRSLGQ